MTYPTELVERAKYEIHVFDRVARDTGIELVAEVEAWRERFPQYEYRGIDDCVALKLDVPNAE